MEMDNLITILSIIGVASIVFYAMFRVSKYELFLNFIMLTCLVFYLTENGCLDHNIRFHFQDPTDPVGFVFWFCLVFHLLVGFCSGFQKPNKTGFENRVY